ncbi:hypothetical protein GCM10010470_27960 [Saccharopolyspora taberi]|uniref:Uncharacterized protein n=1 Tax=Saccharopolyspora taberi TaxID=60895 RepID=A0ABN3VFM7_9PSEU
MRAFAGDSTITSRRTPAPAPLADPEDRPVPPFFFVRVDPATLTCSLLAEAPVRRVVRVPGDTRGPRKCPGTQVPPEYLGDAQGSSMVPKVPKCAPCTADYAVPGTDSVAYNTTALAPVVSGKRIGYRLCSVA